MDTPFQKIQSLIMDVPYGYPLWMPPDYGGSQIFTYTIQVHFFKDIYREVGKGPQDLRGIFSLLLLLEFVVPAISNNKCPAHSDTTFPQGEQVFLKGYRYILFGIQANKTSKDRTRSYLPSQPNLVCSVGRFQYGRPIVRPFHIIFVRITNKIYLESLRHICSSCTSTINDFCKFIRSYRCQLQVRPHRCSRPAPYIQCCYQEIEQNQI